MALDYSATYKLLVLGDSNVGKTCIVHRYCDERYYDIYISTIGIDFKQKIISVDGTPVKLQIWDTAGQERFRTLTTAYYRGACGILLMYDITNLESFNHLSYWLRNIQEIDVFYESNHTKQKRFRTLTTAYYRGACGILLMYDITNLESFNHLSNWLRNIQEIDMFYKSNHTMQERFRTLTTAYYRGACAILLMYDITNLESFNHLSYWLRNIQEYASPDVVKVLVGNKCDVPDNHRAVPKERGQKIADDFDMPFFEVSCKSNINIEESFITLARKIRDYRETKADAFELRERESIVKPSDSETEESKCSC
ncbi:ras family domain-containing protein [Phthorimaea operculella]|nr:ras family domain-containing protein [Phthorimaea operculella]